MGQEEFGQLAYEVMGHVFKIHAEFGRFMREEIYHSEIARRSGGLAKVPVEVRHAGFRKIYFMDLLVGGGALFELKTAQGLTDHHRSQLLQYLLLADLAHGKLVNLRSETVQHEFVNTTLTREHRTVFGIDDSAWDLSVPGSQELRQFASQLLSDLGTALSVSLYEESLVHVLGGAEAVLRDVEVRANGQLIGTQPATLVAPNIAFKVTEVSDKNRQRTEDHLRRFLHHTSLKAIHWINIRQDTVNLKTIH